MEGKREEVAMGRHRASSDPLSRGGNFATGSGGRLDQEPNPFEQSFSGPGPSKPTDGTVTAGGRRARSTSPSSFIPRATPGTGGSKLPPLSFMQTPGGGDLSNFGWGVDSLRTGPLSPALLNGPTYDPHGSNLRTGLTPLVGGAIHSGPQPGTNASGGGGGSAGVSFPPPSPATAALFAMMTNNTPGTADASALAGGGPRPHEGPNEGNQFEASFARANSDSKVPPSGSDSSSIPTSQQPQNHHLSHHAPVNELHRSALNNIHMHSASAPQLPPSAMHHSQGHQPPPHPHAYPSHPNPPYAQHPQHQQPQPPSFPPHAAPHLAHLNPHPHPHPHPPPQHLGHTSYANNVAAPPQPSTSTTNPLDLLSQASFHNDDAVVAAAALSGLATPGGGFNAAAVAALNAAQNGQPQPNVGAPPPGVMPGSTVGGGGGGNNNNTNGSMMQSGGGAKQENEVQPTRGKRQASGMTGASAANGGGGGGAKRTKRSQAGSSAGGMSEEPEGSNDTKKSQPKRAASKRGAAKRKVEEEEDLSMSMAGFDDNGSMMGDGDDDLIDDPAPPAGGQVNKGGRGRKKDTGETEEEKRKNFLERNRQAALKCRQRKKAWLQSLQTKVELLTTDNDTLQTTVTNLTEEVNSLRAILAAHSNCPVAISNGAPQGGIPASAPPPHPQQHHGPPPPHHQHNGMQQSPPQAYAQARY